MYEPILKWIPQIRHRHKYILQELFRPPLTLTHGDAHIENLFFAPRFAGGVSFLDFGNMMFSQAMYDIAFFTVNSLEVRAMAPMRVAARRVPLASRASACARRHPPPPPGP